MIEEMISKSNMPTFYCPYCAERSEVSYDDGAYYITCASDGAIKNEHYFLLIYEKEAWADYEIIYYLTSIDYRMPDFALNVYYPMEKTFIFSRQNKTITELLSSIDTTEWPLYDYPELLKQIKLVVTFS